MKSLKMKSTRLLLEIMNKEEARHLHIIMVAKPSSLVTGYFLKNAFLPKRSTTRGNNV